MQVARRKPTGKPYGVRGVTSPKDRDTADHVTRVREPLMRIPGERLEQMLGYIRFPVDVKHDAGSDLIAIHRADRQMVESLLNEDAIAAIGSRKAINALYLTKPMSELRTSIKLITLPIAADCRTVIREDLGNGRFTYTHNLRRSSAYSELARTAA